MADRIESVLDFILNRATQGELEIMRTALERRLGPAIPGNVGALDFGEMAKKISGDLGGRFQMPGMDQVHDMTRNLVKNMIQEQQPDIPPEHLELLLDEWVPKPGKDEPGREAAMPRDVLNSMVEQFAAFSLGQLPAEEDKSLRGEMPNWPEKYWEIFSPRTKALIKGLINGQMDLGEFRTAFRALLDSREA